MPGKAETPDRHYGAPRNDGVDTPFIQQINSCGMTYSIIQIF